MEERLPVDAPTDRPEFAVVLDGEELGEPARGDVVHLDVHEELSHHGRATLLVRNWDQEQRAVRHSDGDRFAPGTPLEVRLGYAGELETVFSGVVTGLRARFLPTGEPVLEVGARTKGVALSGPRRSRVFEESTDGDVAGTLAGEHGLSATTEAGPQHEALVQWDESDWELLVRRAGALGWALLVRGDELTFAPPARSGSPALALAWGATLLEVDLSQDLGPRPETVTARAWDPETLEVRESEAPGDGSFPAGDRPAPADALGEAGWTPRAHALSHPGPLPTDELDAWAQGEADRHGLGHVWGRGRCSGIPKLAAGTWIELQGVGARLAGTHYLTAVRHVFGPDGYVSEFQVGMPPRLAPDPPAAGRPRPYGGLAVGTVEDIDDPNGWARVKVAMAWTGPEPVSVWARLALPAAGPDQGFFFVPDVGHEVVVGFLGGDTRYPVVLGGVWNGQQAPPESLDAQANAVRSVVSRSGHRFTFDDTDGAALVKVETAGGHSLTLDDGGTKIEMKDSGGSSLVLDSAGVTITAAQGDVTIKSSSGKVVLQGTSGLEGTSQGPAKFQSSATLDLQSSAVLGIQGSLVKIN